jgi:hypothetical protein
MHRPRACLENGLMCGCCEYGKETNVLCMSWNFLIIQVTMSCSRGSVFLVSATGQRSFAQRLSVTVVEGTL